MIEAPQPEQAISLATREVLERSWGVSQQFFERHSPLVGASTPAVALVDAESTPGAVFVFFPVQGERYFFWVRVELQQAQPTITFVGYAPATRAYLSVSSPDLEPAFITERVGITPTDTRLKGSPILSTSRTYDSHLWRCEPVTSRAAFLDHKLNVLVALLRTHAQAFASLPPSTALTLQIVSEQWHAWPDGFHLAQEHISFLASIRAAVDLDLYVAGPPEPAT